MQYAIRDALLENSENTKYCLSVHMFNKFLESASNKTNASGRALCRGSRSALVNSVNLSPFPLQLSLFFDENGRQGM